MAEGPALTFTEHLEELRGRLIICIIAVIVTTIAAFPFADNVVQLLARPLQGVASQRPEVFIHVDVAEDGSARVHLPEGLAGQVIDPNHMPLVFNVQSRGSSYEVIYGRPPATRLYYFGLTDPIYLLFKTAILMGIILALPVIGWQAWLFVGPGLTDEERTVAKPMIWLMCLAFPLGALFAYWILQYAVAVLLRFSFGDLELLPDIGRYLGFIITMMLAFGFVFETPGIFWILGRLGLVTSAWMAGKRKIAIVASFVIAAILTPTPDVFTQATMAVPLILLYEFSIWLVRWTEPKRLA